MRDGNSWLENRKICEIRAAENNPGELLEKNGNVTMGVRQKTSE
jgi:hypothetical protein